MAINLQSMGLKELKDLNVAVTRAIVGFEDRRRIAALAALEATAKDHGYSLQDLIGDGFVPGKKSRATAEPKYINPNNKSDTWSGRGRKPRWFEAALKSGKKPEQMAIQATH